MSVRHGSFTAKKITIETDDGEVVIDREAQVTIADRTTHGNMATLRMLSAYSHNEYEMVLVVGVVMPERQRVGSGANEARLPSGSCDAQPTDDTTDRR